MWGNIFYGPVRRGGALCSSEGIEPVAGTVAGRVAMGVTAGVSATGGSTGAAVSCRQPPTHASDNNKNVTGRDIANSFLTV